jgi:hypothetical protein
MTAVPGLHEADADDTISVRDAVCQAEHAGTRPDMLDVGCAPVVQGVLFSAGTGKRPGLTPAEEHFPNRPSDHQAAQGAFNRDGEELVASADLAASTELVAQQRA